MQLYQRLLIPKIQRALKRAPVVFIIGPRQAGKSTLAKELGGDTYHYISFDDVRYLSSAQSDPIGFISNLPKPVILDEIQRVPELFLTIKKDVDENRIPGRYILTGSANPLLMPKVSDSLAGRMEIFMLYPLAQAEIEAVPGNFISLLFEKNIQQKIKHSTAPSITDRVVRGGYPSVQSIDTEGRESWFNAYVMSLLQRDVQDLARIEGLAQLPMLLQLLGLRAGNLCNIAELSRTAGIPVATVNRYLTLFEALFLVHMQQPWFSNAQRRLVRTPKIYFNDTGLLSFLIVAQPQRFLSDAQFFGSIFENFVVSELFKLITWSALRVKLYHYRTQAGIEVDVILENAPGDLVGIEIKSSETVDSNDFKGIKHLQKEYGDTLLFGIVLYRGTELIPFGTNLFAVPVSALWSW